MTPTPRFTFPAERRLKKPAEFDRVYARKKSAADGVLVVYACENGLPHPRLGCSVSRKVGGAVVRNRYKRLFREAFRLSQHDLPAGVDFILIPRAAKEPPTLDAVRASLLWLGRQAARRLESSQNLTPRPPSLRGKGEQASGNRRPPPSPPPSCSPPFIGEGPGERLSDNPIPQPPARGGEGPV